MQISFTYKISIVACRVIERVGLQAETFASFLMSYSLGHFVITRSHLKLNTLILITDRLHWTVFSSASLALIVNHKVSLLIE
jgi:hypothetical protein